MRVHAAADTRAGTQLRGAASFLTDCARTETRGGAEQEFDDGADDVASN